MATFEETLDKAIEVAVKRALLDAHPVGSIYLTIKDENPSTKFGGTWEKLPSSVCLQTADTTHGAGTTIAAGLPNITGTFNPYSEGSGVATMTQSLTGAFYGVSSNQSGWGTSSGLDKDNYLIGIDASRSSSIYGKSTTVQPPAYALIAWRRTA